MTKKTTATKAVAVSVDKVLKENERLAEELAKALKQCNEQANEIATLHNAVGGLQNEKATLIERAKRIEPSARLAEGLKHDNTILRERLTMAESELFNVKRKLFAKIHEHEAITPNDHSALTAVLPSLLFDVNGEIV